MAKKISPERDAAPARLAGTISWLAEEDFAQCEISNVVFRSDQEIAFDFDYGEPGRPFIYTVVMHKIGTDLLEGEFSAGSGTTRVCGPVNGRLYHGANGIVLVGEWTEEGLNYQWFAELIPDKRAS